MKTYETTEGKAKLANIADHMTDVDDYFAEFAKMIGDKIPNPAEPSAVGLVEKLALYDLSRGARGIPEKLRGLPPIVYRMMEMRVEKMIRACFSAEFADAVQKFRDEVERTAND